MPPRVQFHVINNGPIKVSGASSLRFGEQSGEVSGDVYLCRCGESANMPYCDGSHSRTGFDDACAPQEAKPIRTWEGRTIRTHFNPNACMHVYFCKPLNDLRAADLAGDDDAAAEIIRVVNSCPSGALRYELKGAQDAPAEAAEVDIHVVEGGEIRVTCAFDINEDLPEGLDGTKATLCRCGRSKSKPWCDGRHKGRRGFR